MQQGGLALALVIFSSVATSIMLRNDALAEWLPKALTQSNNSRNGVAIYPSKQTKPPKARNNKTAGVFPGESLNMNRQDCAVGSKTPSLQNSFLPEIKKLKEYEDVCGGRITNSLMTFAAMPSSNAEAIELSDWTASVLKEFAKYKITPIVIFEPTTSKGLINFKDYRDGKYDAYMDAYFRNLKAKGISDATMGIWVPFPEPNIPMWDDTTTSDTVANITKTVRMQKKYFPTSRASVLMDSMSYPSGSHSWSGGAYKSLVPYVKDIPKGLIDSFGYQGFPWSPPANEGGLADANLDAARFLQAGLATEAARALGVTTIWLNTGSFSRQHTGSARTQVEVTSELRSKILQSIVNEALKVKQSGFKVSINVFAEDKSRVAEGNDWSYWQQGKAALSEQTAVFRAFTAAIQDNGFGLSLFDVTH